MHFPLALARCCGALSVLILAPLAQESAPTPAPLQVFVLAGQSNMLEMGTVRAGNTRHSDFYVSAEPEAERGLAVSAYAGAWSADADYDALEAGASATVQMGGDAPFPSLAGPLTHVARGAVVVRESGTYSFAPGYGDSTHNSMELDGVEIYRKERGQAVSVQSQVELEAGVRYPVRITYFGAGWAPLWIRRHGLPGTLSTLVHIEGKYAHLVDEEGDWVTRDDVHLHEARIHHRGGPLAIGESFGPELGFGHVVGDALEAPVLLIKTAMGNRALAWDFRPPSAGPMPNRPEDTQWEGLEYRLMIEGVRGTLEQLDELVPGYAGQGYELAGFAWFQGHKDGGNAAWIAEYEQNLVHLIADVRRDLEAPELPVAVATVGFEGADMPENYLAIRAAQLAVSGTSGRYPQHAGNVLSVDTRDYWRAVEESPRNQGYHYHRNAETYLLVGEALGRAMVELLGLRD